MRVVYEAKKTINERLDDAFSLAVNLEREIKKFIVTEHEWNQLWGQGIRGKKSKMEWWGIPIEKERSK